MAQTAYTGLQGHGKSYEVVRSVILPNFAKGRRIVTNISGLDVELIAQYCKDVLHADPVGFGQIVAVDHSDVVKPDFFPREESENPFARALTACNDPDKRNELERSALAWRDGFVVKGGDIIIIDECWRFYAVGEKLPEYHLAFFRMHRHFTHTETGQCCDIVLIVQDIGDLHRSIRATVEKSFLMKQHVDLGMQDRYVINIYSGKTQTGRTLIEGGINRKYDAAIFPLYKSHSQAKEGGAGPKEERSDKRGSVFNRKLIRYGMPFAVVWLVAAIWYMWGFFHPSGRADSSIVKSPDGAVLAEKGLPVPDKKKKDDGVSEKWTLVGYFANGSAATYMLADGSGKVRYVTNPPAVKVSPGEIEVALPDKSIVSRWSGPDRKSTGVSPSQMPNFGGPKK